MKEKNFRIPLFCAITTLYWFSLYAYVPTLGTYAESLGASHRMVGLILGSYGFVQMLIRIPLGVLSDRVNRRKIFVLLGIALALISALGMGHFNSPVLLLVFRSLSGAAAATWVTYTVLFSSYFKSQDATKAIGYINSFNALGQMAAMLLGGIAAQYLSQQAPFYIAAAGGVIGITAAAGVVEKQNTLRKPVRITELLSVAKDKDLLLVSALAILVQLLTFATVFGFTPVAAKGIGANDFELGILTTISTLPGIFVSALSGAFFARRYGERKTLFAGFMIIAVSCLVIPLINNIYILYVSQFIGGCGRGLVFPLLMGLSIKKTEEDKRATAMGFFQAIYGLGMFIGPIAVGFLSDMAGLKWGFWFTGITGIIGAIISMALITNTAALLKR